MHILCSICAENLKQIWNCFSNLLKRKFTKSGGENKSWADAENTGS